MPGAAAPSQQVGIKFKHASITKVKKIKGCNICKRCNKNKCNKEHKAVTCLKGADKATS